MGVKQTNIFSIFKVQPERRRAAQDRLWAKWVKYQTRHKLLIWANWVKSKIPTKTEFPVNRATPMRVLKVQFNTALQQLPP